MGGDSGAGEQRRVVIDDLPGTPYRLLDRLGGGSAAVVYRGEDTRNGRRVAIKIMRYRRDIAPQLADRMRLEGQALAKLDHRNLVRVLDYGEADEHLYLVMEEAEGKTLDRQLRDGVELSPDQACFIATEVLAALSYVHKRGIVHRDIKPSNIMLLGAGGERGVKLFDFGILKLIDRRAGSLVPLQHPTDKGQRLGTARYVAPEQAASGRVDARSDLYSVGVVLYEMLAAEHPFAHCTTTAELYRAHIAESPPPLAERASQPLPPALVQVVMKSLAKEPDARPRDAARMAAQLKAALAGEKRGARQARKGTMIGIKPREVPSEPPPPQAAADGVAAEVAKARRQATTVRVARPDAIAQPEDERPPAPAAKRNPDTFPDAPAPRRRAAVAALAGGQPTPAAVARRSAASDSSPGDGSPGDGSSGDGAPPDVPSDHGSMPGWYAERVRKVRRESGRGTLGLEDQLHEDQGLDEALDEGRRDGAAGARESLQIPMQPGLGGAGAARVGGVVLGLLLLAALLIWGLSGDGDGPTASSSAQAPSSGMATEVAPSGAAPAVTAPAGATAASAAAGSPPAPRSAKSPGPPAPTTSASASPSGVAPPPESTSHRDHGF